MDGDEDTVDLPDAHEAGNSKVPTTGEIGTTKWGRRFQTQIQRKPPNSKKRQLVVGFVHIKFGNRK